MQIILARSMPLFELEERSVLEYTDSPITDICLDAGVRSQRTFNRAFQEAYRMTPRECTGMQKLRGWKVSQKPHGTDISVIHAVWKNYFVLLRRCFRNSEGDIPLCFLKIRLK